MGSHARRDLAFRTVAKRAKGRERGLESEGERGGEGEKSQEEEKREEGLIVSPGRLAGADTPSSALLSPAPRHPVPAVHDGGPGAGAPADVVPDGSHKLDQGLGGLWDPVVRPHRVVKVADESVRVELVLL